ncbi:MAG: hypothetical protein K0R24_798 [Gammaproteobacteria bacterium]|jgi:hypothetical protein|nr:hypothetical protein [Gammaproteobacteria bacterium]
MPWALLVETCLAGYSDKDYADYHALNMGYEFTPDYEFTDNRGKTYFLKKIQEGGQTVIVDSRIHTGNPVGTAVMTLPDIIRQMALRPTSLWVMNSSLSFEELEEVLNNSTTLSALCLDSNFHHRNKERHSQLLRLVALAKEKNPNLHSIQLKWSPLSEALFEMLIKFAEAGELTSCVLSDHDSSDSRHDRFTNQRERLQQAIEGARKNREAGVQEVPRLSSGGLVAASLGRVLSHNSDIAPNEDKEEVKKEVSATPTL